MEEKVKDKVERLRLKAELFLENNIRAFIKTIQNDYYFCDILVVGDLYLYVIDFDGKRKGEKSRLIWTDISEIYEYVEREKNGSR